MLLAFKEVKEEKEERIGRRTITMNLSIIISFGEKSQRSKERPCPKERLGHPCGRSELSMGGQTLGKCLCSVEVGMGSYVVLWTIFICRSNHLKVCFLHSYCREEGLGRCLGKRILGREQVNECPESSRRHPTSPNYGPIGIGGENINPVPGLLSDTGSTPP